MITTLNNLVDAFKEYAKDHPGINGFGVGSMDYVNTKALKYPYLWIDYSISNILTENNTIIPTVGLDIYVLDKWNNQKNIDITDEYGFETNNLQNIMSLTHQIQLHTTLFIRSLSSQGVKIDGDLSLEPVLDETVDKSYGWKMTPTLRLLNYNCQIPKI